MKSKSILIIVLLCCGLFLPFLGSVHLFDWDEINFAECAREMMLSHNYSTVTIDFLPFWEKPPLFIWMQVFSMKIFGVSAFAGRFPNVLAAILTALFVYFAGKKIKNEALGLWWTVFYLGSFLPNVYFHSGIIDPWFNLLIVGALYFFYFAATSNNPSFYYLIGGISLGLAMLTKGPVALLIVGSVVGLYWLLSRFKKLPKIKHLIIFSLAALSIGGLWFLMLDATGNRQVIEEFIAYQVRLFQTKDAGHGGPIYYHVLFLLLGCFPASFFFIAYQIQRRKMEKNSFDLWMQILFWFTLILFSLVSTKIIHYSSLCYFPISYLAARFFEETLENKLKNIFIKITQVYLLLMGFLLLLLPYLMQNKEVLLNSIKINDPFALANLKANVIWDSYSFIPGLIIILGTMISFLYLRKENLKSSLLSISCTIAIGILALQAFILPKVEQFTQGAAIRYFESYSKQDVYLIPLGYKSYAHLFYGQTKKHTNIKRFDEAWLCNGLADKNVVLISKITTKQNYLNAYPLLKVLKEENGFVFYQVIPKNLKK